MINRIPLVVGASLLVLCAIMLSQMQGVVDAANTIRDVDFNSPFENNTYDLGKPFLVEYDNTTSVVSPGILTISLKLVSQDMG